MGEFIFISNLPMSKTDSSSMSRLTRLFAFSMVQIAMSTVLNPPLGEELPIKPSILTKLSDNIHLLIIKVLANFP